MSCRGTQMECRLNRHRCVCFLSSRTSSKGLYELKSAKGSLDVKCMCGSFKLNSHSTQITVHGHVRISSRVVFQNLMKADPETDEHWVSLMGSAPLLRCSSTAVAAICCSTSSSSSSMACVATRSISRARPRALRPCEGHTGTGPPRPPRSGSVATVALL